MDQADDGGRIEVGTVAPSERTTAPMAEYSAGHVKTGLVVFLLGLAIVVLPLFLL